MDGCCALSLVPVVHKRATYIAYLLPVLVHYYCTFRVHRPGFFLPQKCFTIYVKYTSTRLTVDSYCPYHCAHVDGIACRNNESPRPQFFSYMWRGISLWHETISSVTHPPCCLKTAGTSVHRYFLVSARVICARRFSMKYEMIMVRCQRLFS